MKKDNKSGNSSNEGIQADVVKADVLAVGRGAIASKVIHVDEAQRHELVEELAALRKAVDAMVTEPNARAVVEKDIESLEMSIKDKQIDSGQASGVLQSIVDKLKMIGLVVSEVSALGGPLTKIAGLLHLPLKFMGLP